MRTYRGVFTYIGRFRLPACKAFWTSRCLQWRSYYLAKHVIDFITIKYGTGDNFFIYALLLSFADSKPFRLSTCSASLISFFIEYIPQVWNLSLLRPLYHLSVHHNFQITTFFNHFLFPLHAIFPFECVTHFWFIFMLNRFQWASRESQLYAYFTKEISPFIFSGYMFRCIRIIYIFFIEFFFLLPAVNCTNVMSFKLFGMPSSLHPDSSSSDIVDDLEFYLFRFPRMLSIRF